MSDALQLILEDNDGTQLETSCSRFAVVWQGKELWVQAIGDQLLIGVDVEEGDTEYVNLLLEMEPMIADEDDHVHGPDCNH